MARWIPFDFDDFCGDDNLQSCPLDTQGFYVHLMKVLNRANPPGYLTRNGGHMPRKTLASLLPFHWQTIEKHLRILKANGVLKKDKNGLWYSKRMYEDWLKYAESQDYGKLGGNPKLKPGGLTGGVKGGVNGGVKANKNKNKNKNKKDTYTQEFESFWKIYPRKIEKHKAFKCWQTRLKEGVKPTHLKVCADNYAGTCEALKTEMQFIKHPATFLSSDKPYEDYRVSTPVGATQPQVPLDKYGNPYYTVGGENIPEILWRQLMDENAIEPNKDGTWKRILRERNEPL